MGSKKKVQRTYDILRGPLWTAAAFVATPLRLPRSSQGYIHDEDSHLHLKRPF